ncbi:sensor domain-containing protein [Nocardia sp. NPDC052566]|uniref:sensor domain-containing protein n=1 Tax=Nocardia sp. NPDC052566 TaxID=3364330 RepID=UPI0037CAB68A
MSSLRKLLRSAAYALWALPLAATPVAVRLRVPRRMFGESFALGERLAVRAAVHAVLSGVVGLLTWFLAFLAGLAAVRGAFYPLLASGNYENSWGGPTLAGAWAVHALLGIGLLPAWLAVLAALGVFQRRLARALLGRAAPRWPIPLAVALTAGGIVLFIAWLHQI